MTQKKFLLLFFLPLLLNVAFKSNAQVGYDYKTVTMFHLIEQIQWNPAPIQERFTIGVLDAQGLAYKGVSEVASYKRLKQFGKVRVKRFSEVSKVKNCNVLFISYNSAFRLTEVLQKIDKKPCLIITEDLSLFGQGSHINFITKGSRLEFSFNKEIMQDNGLYPTELFSQLALADVEERSAKSNTPTVKKLEKDNSQLRNKVKQLETNLRKDQIISEKQIQEFSSALDSLNFSASFKDSIIRSFEHKMRMQRLLRQNTELQKKKFELEVQNELNRRANIAQTRFYYNIIAAILIGVVSVLALVFFLVMRRRNKTIRIINQTKEQLAEKVEQVTAQKSQIDLQKKNIQDSIRAALTIQTAMLLDMKMIRQYVPESFIFFKPRDIVSGDFYWFAEVQSRQPIFQPAKKQLVSSEDSYEIPQKSKWIDYGMSTLDYHLASKWIFAAVDCTGHGVPGAFMSMVGNEALNEIIHRRKIYEPDKILHELHLSITATLKQHETGNLDGMDIAICTVEKIISEDKNSPHHFKVEFSGAKRPLIYIENGELTQLNGTNASIGGFQIHREKKFIKHSFWVQSPCNIYLFSDGIQDQLNGETRKRFSSERLKQTFLQIHTWEAEQQRTHLEQVIQEWMGEVNQVDDILVIGFKF